MKTKKPNEEVPTPQVKAKVKIKNLKLHKETIENLSEKDAEAVRGGGRGTVGC